VGGWTLFHRVNWKYWGWLLAAIPKVLAFTCNAVGTSLEISHVYTDVEG
jgi:hypothetical protein